MNLNDLEKETDMLDTKTKKQQKYVRSVRCMHKVTIHVL